jgi:hypothetical protein
VSSSKKSHVSLTLDIVGFRTLRGALRSTCKSQESVGLCGQVRARERGRRARIGLRTYVCRFVVKAGTPDMWREPRVRLRELS